MFDRLGLFLNSTFSPQKFLDHLFRILPLNCTFYLLQILMTFFSHRPFLLFSTLPCFTDDDSYFLFFPHYTPLTPCIHNGMLFFTFLRLALYALVRVNDTYAVYFFLIHHCTNSLSSLHILCITAH